MDNSTVLILFFLAIAGLASAGGVMAWRAFLERRHQARAEAPRHPLLTMPVVLGDVQGRTLDQFVATGLKGIQTRSALHEGPVPLRLTYTVKRLPNGVEHTFEAGLGGPPVKDDAAAKQALANVAQHAVYLALLTRLEPPTPLDLDLTKRTLGLTRVVTEDETRALQVKRLKAPALETAEQTFEKAAAEAAEVRRQLGVEG